MAGRLPRENFRGLLGVHCALLSTFLLVLLGQRFAIDPCWPSLLIFMRRVTALESRTPHQPEKPPTFDIHV